MSSNTEFFPQPYHTNQYMHFYDFLRNYNHYHMQLKTTLLYPLELTHKYPDTQQLQEAQNLGQSPECLKKLFMQHYEHVLYFDNQKELWNSYFYNREISDKWSFGIPGKIVLWPNRFNKDMLFILNESDIFPEFTKNYELVATAVITVPASSYPGRGVWYPTRKIKYRENGEYGVGNMIVRNKSSDRLELWNPNAWMGVGHKTNTQRYIYAADATSVKPMQKHEVNNYYIDTLAMDNLISNAALDKDFMTALLSARINRKQNYHESRHSLPKGYEKSEIDDIITYHCWKNFVRGK